MLVAAAVVPATPLLVPAVAGGSASVDDVLRRRALDAVRTALEGEPEAVVVLGAAPRTGPLSGGWDWASLGVACRKSPGPALPLSLGVGDWLLDQVGWTGNRRHVGVSEDEPPDSCRRLGATLTDGRRCCLLVCGDGSARRTEKAPGSFDPRAAGFDRAVVDALAAGDAAALTQLDPDLGRALLAAGRAPWQVLAGAAEGGDVVPDVQHDEAPYGVGYVVATWVMQVSNADS
jgi:hypothetical protein